MNFNNYLKNLSSSRFHQIISIIFFIFFFIIGLSIYKDFGLSADEPFQRSIGYFWYIYLLEFFSINIELVDQVKKKFELMYWSDYIKEGNLTQYGVFFETFASLVEEIFKIENSQKSFYFKHLLTFCFFFLSSIFFYKIIRERYNNTLYSILITFFFLSSPRIFAEAFYNCKDIVFMSFCVFSLYFAVKNFDDLNYKNLFLFSLFTALATNVRIMGIILFFLFFIFLLLNCLEEKNFLRKNIRKIIFLLFSFPVLIYVFWPFLWNAPLDNFIFTIKSFTNFNWSGQGILYLGTYHKASNLPWHYIPVWIIATTPIILTLFFLIGFSYISINFFNKFLNLSETNKLWTSSKEKKDLFVFLFFLTPIFLVVFLNSTLYGGWRHLYFIYPSFIYIASIGITFLLQKERILKIKNIIYTLIVFLLLNNFYNLIKFHPYQNVYFNYFFEKNANKLFEVDYWGLGNAEALRFLSEKKYTGKKINIKVSSYTPLEYSKLILKSAKKNVFSSMITTDKGQKFIFSNYVYERNPNYEKKYLIPSSYSKIYTLKRGNIVINEIFEKIK